MDIDQLMEQAKEMQEQMKKAHDELSNTQVEGVAGAGLVKCKMDGRHQVQSIVIANKLWDKKKKSDAEGEGEGGSETVVKFIQDLIMASFNDAVRQVEDLSKQKIMNLAEGMDLPEGMNLPPLGDQSDS